MYSRPNKLRTFLALPLRASLNAMFFCTVNYLMTFLIPSPICNLILSSSAKLCPHKEKRRLGSPGHRHFFQFFPNLKSSLAQLPPLPAPNSSARTLPLLIPSRQPCQSQSSP